MVSPGCLVSMEAATSAVVSEPDTGSAFSSTRKTRSASPSKARPMSAPCSSTACFKVDQVLGLDRVGGMVGEGAVELGEEDVDREGEPLEDDRHDQAAHAVGRVGHHLERPQRRPRRRRRPTWSAHSASRSSSRRAPVERRAPARRAASRPRPRSRPGRCRARSGGPPRGTA